MNMLFIVSKQTHRLEWVWLNWSCQVTSGPATDVVLVLWLQALPALSTSEWVGRLSWDTILITALLQVNHS